jgi:adenosylcobyric acid synthase
VTYQQPKILKRGAYRVFNFDVQGYEIHCGRLARYPLYYQAGHIAGTHVHGVFDDNFFRTAYFKTLNPAYQGFDYVEYRETAINAFTNMVRDNLDLNALL